MAIKQHSRNMIFIFLGDAAARLLGFLAIAYLARILDKPAFGIMNIGLAVLNYTLLIGNSGLALSGTRAVAGNDKALSFLTGRIIVTRMLLSFLAYIVSGLILYLFVSQPDVPEITMVFLLFLFPMAMMLDWYFQGKQEMGTMAFGRFLGMLCYLLFILIFVRANDDLIMTAWGWVAGGVVNGLWLLFVFRKQSYQITFRWQGANLFQLWKNAFPLGVASLISQVVLQFPIIYLGWFYTTTDAGIFSAAFRATALLLIFDRVFYTIFFPVISRNAAASAERSQEIVKRVLKVVVVSGLCISLLAIFMAEWLIFFIFSEKYQEAILVFQILTGYFALTLTNSVVGYTLVGLNEEKTFTRALFLGLCFFFAAIFALPGQWGLTGVAIALVLYQIVAVIIMSLKLGSFMQINFKRHLVLPFFAAFLVILPALYSLEIILPLKISLLILFCFPLLARAGGIKWEDVLYFKKVLI